MSSSQDAERISPEAVAELYAEFGDDLRAYLTAVLKDREQALEVLQVVLRKTLEQGHLVTENLRGWVMRVALQEAMLLRRNQTRERQVLEKAAWKQSKPSDVPDLALSVPMTVETVKIVRQAISDLTPDQQQVVRLRIYEDKTFAVIAQELKLPLGTVLSRMRAALQKLEVALKDYAKD